MIAKFTMVSLLSALTLLLGNFYWLAPTKMSNALDDRQQAAELLKQSNFNDAYEIYRKLLNQPESADANLVNDFQQAVFCLNQLQRINELDTLRENLLRLHPDKWRLHQQVASSLLFGEHFGYIVAGNFSRGHARGSGEWHNSTERDRVRVLQILTNVLKTVETDQNAQPKEVAEFYFLLAQAARYDRDLGNSWKLQVLSDLTSLPDYQPMTHHWGSQGMGGGVGWGGTSKGAPVDAEGNPVLYSIPKSWEEAQNDGERSRWAFEQAAQKDQVQFRDRVDLEFAQFLVEQFGVQTMAQYRTWFREQEEEDGPPQADGPFAVSTLGDDETICRLATGIKRIQLPPDFNHVRLFQGLTRRKSEQTAYQAHMALGNIYENRQQYSKAADHYRKALEQKTGDGAAQQRLDQIVKPWGMFEPIETQTVGKGASVELRFRNGKQVNFKANRINLDALLKDVKEHLKSNPHELQWERIQIDAIGYNVLQNHMAKYVGEEVAKWDLALEPRQNHFDRRITITTPLQKAGAYLLTASMPGGNEFSIVIWIADTALAKKSIHNGNLYMVADAETGKPIPNCNVEFFGWKSTWDQRGNRQILDTRNFAETSDKDGFVEPSQRQLDNQYQWLTVARTPEGRLAFLGMTGIWFGNYPSEKYREQKAYGISDRPIYRPDQTVKYKFWIRTVSYQSDRKLELANQQVRVQIYDPQGNVQQNEIRQLDQDAAFSGELKLAADATLGAYSIQVSDLNQRQFGYSVIQFRVEEYKKPEFEVTVKAPEKPVRLGETIPVKISAQYYFGGAVTEGVVKYKVHRTKKNPRWFPIGPWDWLYGNGYLWLAADYAWYPGFARWGCWGPVPPWWGYSADPPELVIDEEGKLDADGNLEFEIDTAIIKAVHGNDDHEFSITAEVVDSSRRTIVGSGSVVVARRPFSIYVWSNRGYTRVGDSIRVYAKAKTADGKGVAGKGKLILNKVVYDKDGKPTETQLQSWDVTADEEGNIEQQIKATEAGQFRLVVSMAADDASTIEGGQMLHVVGEGFDSANFRYNDLEVIVEQAHYAPGDKVKLLINTNRAGARLMVWERPQGIYAARPIILQLNGKSAEYEMTVAQDDMPNFFVEVMTIFGGKVHMVAKEVFVPPVSKVVKVEIESNDKKVLPGAETEVKVKLTDPEGKPFTGSLVMTMYDRAVEYISGGSNVPDIHEHFWKWKRYHNPQTEHSLTRMSNNLVRDGQQQMQFLGVFGNIVTEIAQGGMGGELMFQGGGRGGGMPGGAVTVRADSAVVMEEGVPAAMAFDGNADMAAKANQSSEAAMIQPVVRTNFADAAYWSVDLRPDGDGVAIAKIKMPENLTSWKIRTWAMGTDTSVGEATTEIVTAKNIMVRLQAPRFFVEKDEVILSAIVHNYLDVAKKAEVSLELSGDFLQTGDSLNQTVELPSGGQKRVNWRVKVLKEGEVAVTMAAKTDVESDAMQMKFPVLVHGILKTESFSGIVRQGTTNTKFAISVPAQRRAELSRLEIRFSPTLAGAMVDALPYLNAYPYGCTEQTLNRFLPTVITLNVLKRMNLDFKAIQEKRTNLNAQEIGDDQERAKRWAYFNPVFDEAEVLQMAKQGVADLAKMQNSDGGWGWFSGYGERSWPHTTATVVRGLKQAQTQNIGIVPGVLENGIAWLKRYQDEQVQLLIEGDRQRDLPPNHPDPGKPHRSSVDNLDALVYLTLVECEIVDRQMADYLYRDRASLSLYGKGLAGLAYHLQQDQARRDMLIQNINQFVKFDDENQSAFIDLPNQTYWWFWYGDTIEANAMFLKLMSQTKPDDKVTLGLVKYLINNRRHANYWKSTRDTALCVEAFADFIQASGEDQPEMTVEVVLDGTVVKTEKIDSSNLFQFDNKFVLEGAELADGEHEVEIRRTGKGTVYTNAYLTNFTQEDEIAAAGLEIQVDRAFYRLEQLQDAKSVVSGDRGQSVDQKLEKYKRIPLESWDEVRSGDLVEIELEIDSKNDYEYVIFEDLKAAGCEPVDLQSGYRYGGLNAYVEFRDQRVAFFARFLRQGKHSVSYRMRAETPGSFSALPTKAYAMYAPELRANSNEMKLKIRDREEFGE